jgi:phosphoserine phosphatase
MNSNIDNKLIVLDIDRTIVHSCLKYFVKDNWIENYKTFNFDAYVIFLRPHLEKFLNFLKEKKYKVALFTGGDKDYANFIKKNILDKYLNVPLEFVYSRVEADESFDFDGKLKSVNYISNQINIPVENILLIDDANNVKRGNPNNCYQISPFVVCCEIKHIFVPEMINDNQLIKCMDWLTSNFDNTM